MTSQAKTLRVLLAIAGVVAASATSGCFPLFKKPTEVWSAQAAHPITVDADTASMAVPVGGLASGLSSDSDRDVRAFLAVYKARGHGPLTIARPVGAGNDKAAGRVATDILHVATQVGVSPDDLMPQSYQVSAGVPEAPVMLSFTRFVASAAPCGDWSHNMGQSTRNTEMPDLGCATQNNFAAMVEDPHDLIGPRGVTAADAERRAAVFDKYRKGETTITDRKTTERGNVSKTESGGE
jgi:pilus assembly protein CpaD